jgi:Uma2 family endonuclease
MTTQARHLVTAEELLQMQDEDCRTELIDGEILRMAPAGGEHGEVTHNAGLLLGVHVRAGRLGRMVGAETGFLLRRHPDLVRAPDVAFIARQRIPPGGLPKGYIPFPPDLAVEVVSPNDTDQYVLRKVQDWLAAGTRLLWLVYPGRARVVVHAPGQSIRTLGPDDLLDGDDVLRGFSCRVAELLPEPVEAESQPSA